MMLSACFPREFSRLRPESFQARAPAGGSPAGSRIAAGLFRLADFLSAAHFRGRSLRQLHPAAGFEDWLGGGSGYGEGVPKVFMRFFETIYLPVFHRMFAAGINLRVPFTYAPVVLCYRSGGCHLDRPARLEEGSRPAAGRKRRERLS